ncbi:MAG: DUF5301 domain-containing protein [Clostridia bacterium]|nr:DUF5301 domain-containing protein [Clostridia bacterium]
MKSKLIVSAAVIVVLLTGALIVFDSVFPKAPAVKEVFGTVISVEYDDNGFLTMLESAKRTRRMSVNDAPTVSEYKTATVNTENGSYVCYIYEEYSETYIEIPYVGIYRVK